MKNSQNAQIRATLSAISQHGAYQNKEDPTAGTATDEMTQISAGHVQIIFFGFFRHKH